MKNCFHVRQTDYVDYNIPIREKIQKINMACNWLFAGKTAVCGKPCRGDYCFRHRRFNPLLPCKQCGKGTRNELCKECVARCEWLKLGKSETCGKSCDGIYCRKH